VYANYLDADKAAEVWRHELLDMPKLRGLCHLVYWEDSVSLNKRGTRLLHPVYIMALGASHEHFSRAENMQPIGACSRVVELGR